jgi:hypothetical protein
MNKVRDYKTLEHEFISGDMSLRELCRSHGITAHSAVMLQARKGDWAEKRRTYRERASAKYIEMRADRDATREAEVRDNAIEAIDEAITKMRGDMKATRMVLRHDQLVEEPVMRLRPQEVVMLIDRLNVLFGKPSQITEERSLGIKLDTGQLGPAELAEFIERTRGLGPVGGGSAASPIPRTDRTVKN